MAGRWPGKMRCQSTSRKRRRRKRQSEKISSPEMPVIARPPAGQPRAYESGAPARRSTTGSNGKTNDDDEMGKRTLSWWSFSRCEANRKGRPKSTLGGLRRPLLTLASFVLVLVGQHHQQGASGSTLADFDGATFYKAPVGSRVRIACNASHWHDDSISLVLWFKGNPNGGANVQPIYTIDARQRPLSSGQARHLVADSLRGRAKFVLPSPLGGPNSSTPTQASNNPPASTGQVPYLDLAPLEAEDQAEYRCRVDYRSRPRENFLVVLFVLVPPSAVQIMDANGRALEQIYGPLNEGAQLTLLCLAKGGRPAPAVVWRRHNSVIDDSYLTVNDFLTLKLAGAQNASQISDNDLAGLHRPEGHQARGATSSTKLAEWPEFNYFHHSSEIAAATGNGQLGQRGEPEARGDLVASGRQVGAQLARARTEGSAAATSVPLIEWQADKTMTTSVNVLHLGELTRAHLTPAGEQQVQVAGSRQAATARLAQLECQASNMHYDLRALIKIFAPPSLQPQVVEGPAVVGPHLARGPPRNSTGGRSAASAFAQAVERALLANLKSFSPPGQQQAADEPTGGGGSRSAAPLRNSSLAAPEPGGPESAAATTSAGQESNWQQLIYQQLIRPHELLAASSAGAQSAPARDDQPAGPSSSTLATTGQAASQQQLARSALIALEANLRPLDVKITSPARPLAAGQVHDFTCRSAGSRPPARLSWFKNGLKLEPRLARQLDTVELAATTGQANENNNDNKLANPRAAEIVSQSRLALKLDRDDHNARLTCRAENANFRSPPDATSGSSSSEPGAAGNASEPPSGDSPDWFLEDSVALSVHYAPQVRLELGNKMLSERIREDQDIYFVCQVDAQPPVSEITWLHNNRPVNESGFSSPSEPAQASPMPPNGPGRRPNLILSNNSLVLQRVQLDQSGQYACLASNSEGLGLSNRLEMRVLHAPVCVAPDRREPPLGPTADGELHLGTFRLPGGAGISHDEPRLELACRMLVEPAEDEQLEFSWFLGEAGPARRLLGRARRPDVKLIEVEAPDWRRPANEPGELGPAGLSHRGDSPTPPQPPPPRVAARHKQVVALARLQVDPSWFEPAGQVANSSTTEQSGGRVYCLARNSIGAQRRACVYSIERAPVAPPAGDPPRPSQGSDSSSGASFADDEAAAAAATDEDLDKLACLPVNVTASSVWIGCDLAQAARKWPGMGQAASEISQVEENNDQLRLRPGDEQGPISGARFRFNVLVHSLPEWPGERQTSVTNSDQLGPSQQKQQQRARLEANLTSHQLSEPLFAVVNLEPATNYLLEIRDLSQQQMGPAAPSWSSVRLRTAPASAAGGGPAEDPQQPGKLAIESSRARPTGEGGERAGPRPSIRQVTEPHPSDLVAAALISTRSTPVLLQAAGGRDHRQPPGGVRPAPADPARPASSFWPALSSTFSGLLGGATPADPQRGVAQRRAYQGPASGQQASGRWLVGALESTDALVAFAAFVAALLATLVGLIALHRRAGSLCAARDRGRDSNQHRKASLESSSSSAATNTTARTHKQANGRADLGDRAAAGALLLAGEPQQHNGRQLTQRADAISGSPPPADNRRSVESSFVSSSSVGPNLRPPHLQHHQQNRYSTLQGRPSINFLRTSSISSANSNANSLQRHAGPNLAALLQPALLARGARRPPFDESTATSVTRSRSSSGFQANDELLGPVAAAANLAANQPARFAQPSGELLAQLPRAESLISDANLVGRPGEGSGAARHLARHGDWPDGEPLADVYANVARSTCRGTVMAGQQQHLPFGPDEAAAAAGQCNCHELSQALEAAQANQHLGQLIGQAGCLRGVHFSAALAPSPGADSTASCSMAEAHLAHQHEICPHDDWLGQQQQQEAKNVDFIELVQAGDLQNELMVVQPGMHDQHHRHHHHHHVMFNQSLNSSSSLASPSLATMAHATNTKDHLDQFSSPQLSTTNTSQLSNQDSQYQQQVNMNQHNMTSFVFLTKPTLCDESQRPNGANEPHHRQGSKLPAGLVAGSTKLGSGASTSNYSSDGSSSVGITTTTTNSASQNGAELMGSQPVKTRLTSILKQGRHQPTPRGAGGGCSKNISNDENQSNQTPGVGQENVFHFRNED